MTTLTALMTRFCAGEDNWLTRKINNANDPGTSKIRDGNGKPRRTEHNSHNNTERLRDTAVNVGFHNPKPGQRKKPFKAKQDGQSPLDRILD